MAAVGEAMSWIGLEDWGIKVEAEDFLRRFFSMPRGRKRLAVLATGFR